MNQATAPQVDEDFELQQALEAHARSNQKTMQGDTFRECFGDAFAELRTAITKKNWPEVIELVDDIENSACNVVEQWDSAWRLTNEC